MTNELTIYKLKELVLAYLREETGADSYILDKGYRPAQEALVISLGLTEDYHSDKLLVRLKDE